MDDLLLLRDEPVEVLALPVAQGLVLELVYDDGGILVATWRSGAWWRIVDVGEA